MMNCAPTTSRVPSLVLVLSLSLSLFLVAGCDASESGDAINDDETAQSATSSGAASSVSGSGATSTLPATAVRHVVIFRYRDTATEGEITQVTDAFRALRETIPGILDFERGVNHSPEGLNQGFTHAYTLTFENEAARDAYLPHPDHVAFGELLAELGVVEEVFVVDYTPLP